MGDREGGYDRAIQQTGNTFVFQAGSNPTFYVGDTQQLQKLEQVLKEYLAAQAPAPELGG